MMINVLLNGENAELPVELSLAQAIVQWGYSEGPFAVALNERFVARSDYAGTVLSNGDHIDIVSPIQGG